MNQLDSMSHNVRDEGVGGSNPLTPTITSYNSRGKTPQPVPQVNWEKGIKGIKRYRHPVSGIWYHYHRRSNQRIMAKWGTATFLKEIAALDRHFRPEVKIVRGDTTPAVRRHNTQQQLTMSVHLFRMAKAIRQRAPLKGVPIDFTLEDIKALYDEQGGKCALSGIEFNLHLGREFRLRPWAPSPDRINTKKGYVKGNVRLLCTAVNIARSDFTDEIFITMIQSVYKHSLKKALTEAGL
jgi:hypothetical protein